MKRIKKYRHKDCRVYVEVDQEAVNEYTEFLDCLFKLGGLNEKDNRD